MATQTSTSALYLVDTTSMDTTTSNPIDPRVTPPVESNNTTMPSENHPPILTDVYSQSLVSELITNLEQNTIVDQHTIISVPPILPVDPIKPQPPPTPPRAEPIKLETPLVVESSLIENTLVKDISSIESPEKISSSSTITLPGVVATISPKNSTPPVTETVAPVIVPITPPPITPITPIIIPAVIASVDLVIKTGADPATEDIRGWSSKSKIMPDEIKNVSKEQKPEQIENKTVRQSALPADATLGLRPRASRRVGATVAATVGVTNRRNIPRASKGASQGGILQPPSLVAAPVLPNNTVIAVAQPTPTPDIVKPSTTVTTMTLTTPPSPVPTTTNMLSNIATQPKLKPTSTNDQTSIPMISPASTSTLLDSVSPTVYASGKTSTVSPNQLVVEIKPSDPILSVLPASLLPVTPLVPSSLMTVFSPPPLRQVVKRFANHARVNPAPNGILPSLTMNNSGPVSMAVLVREGRGDSSLVGFDRALFWNLPQCFHDCSKNSDTINILQSGVLTIRFGAEYPWVCRLNQDIIHSSLRASEFSGVMDVPVTVGDALRFTLAHDSKLEADKFSSCLVLEFSPSLTTITAPIKTVTAVKQPLSKNRVAPRTLAQAQAAFKTSSQPPAFNSFLKPSSTTPAMPSSILLHK